MSKTLGTMIRNSAGLKKGWRVALRNINGGLMAVPALGGEYDFSCGAVYIRENDVERDPEIKHRASNPITHVKRFAASPWVTVEDFADDLRTGEVSKVRTQNGLEHWACTRYTNRFDFEKMSHVQTGVSVCSLGGTAHFTVKVPS